MHASSPTIGIIGGGQLGRMLAVAAAQLGYQCHVYAPEESGPAGDVARSWTRGAYDDEAALARFAAGVDIVTYEFENIPAASVKLLAALRDDPKTIAENVMILDMARNDLGRICEPGSIESLDVLKVEKRGRLLQVTSTSRGNSAAVSGKWQGRGAPGARDELGRVRFGRRWPYRSARRARQAAGLAADIPW